MTRLARYVLAFCVFGFSAGVPAETQAELIPGTYNSAVYRPVQYSTGYGPYTSYGVYSSYYAPYSSYYAPYSTVTAGYAPASGCGCNTSYYAPSLFGRSCCGGCSSCGYSSGCSSCGASGCSSCSSGGCSSGNCSSGNCSSTPMTSGYGPTNTPAPAPDPNFNNYNGNLNNSTTRDLNSRINDLEHQIRVLDHRQKEDEQFLNRTYQGKYAPSPYSSGASGNSGTSGTYINERNETVPPRHRRDSFGTSDQNTTDDNQMYRPRKSAPVSDPIDQESRKPDLSAPTPDDKDLNQKSRESEPQAFKLDLQVTSAGVAPRERMEILTKDSKIKAIAKANKRTIKTSENHPSTDLARQ